MSKTMLEQVSDKNLLMFHASELPKKFFRLSPSAKRRLKQAGFIITRLKYPGCHTATLTPKALAIMKAEMEDAPIVTDITGKTRRLRR